LITTAAALHVADDTQVDRVATRGRRTAVRQHAIAGLFGSPSSRAGEESRCDHTIQQQDQPQMDHVSARRESGKAMQEEPGDILSQAPVDANDYLRIVTERCCRTSWWRTKCRFHPLDVVAELRLVARAALVTRRLPPAVDAIDGRIDEVSFGQLSATTSCGRKPPPRMPTSFWKREQCGALASECEPDVECSRASAKRLLFGRPRVLAGPSG
jgi:hypothetical protein